MSEYACFLCDKIETKDSEWSLGSLKLIQSQFKLCKTHLDFCTIRIPELEKTEPKEEPKLTTVFIPKIVDVGKNFSERQVGEEG